MLIKADGVTRIGWALCDLSTGHIHLCELCEDESDSVRLAAAHREYKPHEHRKVPVRVIITITGCK